eukprot:GHVR01089394.1.p1 GENE.GHVR01089394.1~~GHVR01089394.1.p1  ORF type:complete len:215 (+),score=62.96 GHVR01089394.1:89-733(+)
MVCEVLVKVEKVKGIEDENAYCRIHMGPNDLFDKLHGLKVQFPMGDDESISFMIVDESQSNTLGACQFKLDEVRSSQYGVFSDTIPIMYGDDEVGKLKLTVEIDDPDNEPDIGRLFFYLFLYIFLIYSGNLNDDSSSDSSSDDDDEDRKRRKKREKREKRKARRRARRRRERRGSGCSNASEKKRRRKHKREKRRERHRRRGSCSSCESSGSSD